MILPGVHQHPHLPRHVVPFALGLTAVFGTLIGWAFLAAGTLTNESQVAAPPLVAPGSVRSIAYTVPEGSVDTLYIRRAGVAAQPVAIAAFPVAFGLHARGSASPLADRAAVISPAVSGGAGARVTLLDLPSGSSRDAAAPVDYLSPLAWSADGGRIAAVHTGRPDDTGRVTAEVIEFDAATGSVLLTLPFEDVLSAVPVGYSIDGERFFVVVIDQSGSALWMQRDGRLQKVALLSAGRTRDWSLSPDGARLAYVDILGAGERGYAGRVLTIATGTIAGTGATSNEFGPAWIPGSQLPVFGGPGGAVRLNPPSPEGDYVIPASWSPDGSMLVATIYSASSDRTSPLPESIELVSEQSRVLLSDTPGVHFIGWVRNVE